jgi:hypothetical protein
MGVHAHPPFTISTITYKDVVWTLQLRGKIHYPYLYSPICTLCFLGIQLKNEKLEKRKCTVHAPVENLCLASRASTQYRPLSRVAAPFSLHSDLQYGLPSYLMIVHAFVTYQASFKIDFFFVLNSHHFCYSKPRIKIDDISLWPPLCTCNWSTCL